MIQIFNATGINLIKGVLTFKDSMQQVYIGESEEQILNRIRVQLAIAEHMAVEDYMNIQGMSIRYSHL